MGGGDPRQHSAGAKGGGNIPRANHRRLRLFFSAREGRWPETLHPNPSVSRVHYPRARTLAAAMLFNCAVRPVSRLVLVSARAGRGGARSIASVAARRTELNSRAKKKNGRQEKNHRRRGPLVGGHALITMMGDCMPCILGEGGREGDFGRGGGVPVGREGRRVFRQGGLEWMDSLPLLFTFSFYLLF